MKAPIIYDLYVHHAKYGYGRLEELDEQARATVKFDCGRKLIKPSSLLRAVRVLEVVLGGGKIVKGRRKALSLPWSLGDSFKAARLRTLQLEAIKNGATTVVGPIPQVTVCKPSRRGMRQGSRLKRTVQLYDSDRNRDIGYTHDGHNQGYDRRTDSEGFENETDITSTRIRMRNIPDDPLKERDGDVARFHDVLHTPYGEPASYAKSKAGRARLNVKTVIDTLGRERKRLLKVLEYWKKGVSVRRTGQLMHLEENKIKSYRRQLREADVAPDRDSTRDHAGQFIKRQ